MADILNKKASENSVKVRYLWAKNEFRA